MSWCKYFLSCPLSLQIPNFLMSQVRKLNDNSNRRYQFYDRRIKNLLRKIHTDSSEKPDKNTPEVSRSASYPLLTECHYSNTTNLNSCGEKLLEFWSYLGGTCISVEAASSHRAVMDTLQGVWCGTVIVLVSKVNAGGFFLPCSRAAQWRSRSGIMWAAPWSSSSASTPEPRTCSPSFIASPTAARTTARAKCEGTVLQMTLMPKTTLNPPVTFTFTNIFYPRGQFDPSN